MMVMGILNNGFVGCKFNFQNQTIKETIVTREFTGDLIFPNPSYIPRRGSSQ